MNKQTRETEIGRASEAIGEAIHEWAEAYASRAADPTTEPTAWEAAYTEAEQIADAALIRMQPAA